MESLFNVKQKQREELNQLLGNALGSSRSYAFGAQAGSGLRGLLGQKTPAEQMAMKMDAARKSVTAPAGTPEYFAQFAEQLDALGLKDAASQAVQAGQQAREKQLGLATAERQASDIATARELAKGVVGDIKSNPGEWYRAYGSSLMDAGLTELADKAMATSREYKKNNESLEAFIGIKSATIRRAYSPESIKNANIARLNGGTRAEVMEILEKGANKGFGNLMGDDGKLNPAVKDLLDIFDGPILNGMGRQSRERVLGAMGQVLEGDVAPLIDAMKQAKYSSTEAEGAAMEYLKEADEARSAANQELQALGIMKEKASNMITGTFAPSRLAIKTAFASAGLVGAETLDELANTNVFLSQLGQLVLSRIKTLGTNPSDADRQFLLEMLPKLTSDPTSILKVIEYLEKRAKSVADKATNVQSWYKELEKNEFTEFTLPSEWISMKGLDEAAEFSVTAEDFAGVEFGRNLPPEFYDSEGKLLDNRRIGEIFQNNYQGNAEVAAAIKEAIEGRGK